MKKFAIFALSLLSLGFVACEDESSLGVTQTNPQETIMEANGLTVAFGENLQGSAINLASLSEGVEVIKTELAENLPEGSVVTYKMQVANNENYQNATMLDVKEGKVSAAEWNDWFRANIGRAPYAKENWVRFAAYTVSGNQTVRLGGEDFWYGAKKISVTPIDLGLKQEAMYYIIDNTNSFNYASGVAMNHSDKDQYDDPVFTIKLDVANGYEFFVIPQSAKDAGQGAKFGVANASAPVMGEWAALTDAQPKAIAIEGGQYLLSVNMETNEYMLMVAIENLWTPGDSNGWNHDAAQMLYTDNYADYFGFAHLNGGFKFTSAADWNHTNFGKGGEGILSTDGGAGNLNSGADGLFWCQANIANLTYSLTEITSCGLIGDFNGWGSQSVMTPSADFLVWTGDVDFSGTGSFKIRFNDNWDINLGGEMNNLSSFNAPNIAEPGAGKYEAKLDLSKLPYTLTLTKK